MSYYEILGISKDSDEKKIKKAYMDLAKKYHPDKNTNDPDAAEKFKKIAEAYEVLSNPEKRRIFDQFGEEGLKGQGGPNINPEDIFNNVFRGFGGFGNFGGFGGFNPFGQGQQQKDDIIKINLPVTLKELYMGCTKEVNYQVEENCNKCNGNGTKSGNKPPQCSGCNGKGVCQTFVQMGPGIVQQIIGHCDKCNGNKFVPNKDDKCDKCNGSGKMKNVKSKIVEISRGDFGNDTKYYPEDKLAIILSEYERDSKFNRKGNDLIYELNITLVESLIGFSKIIKHLDGRKLLIEQRGVVSPKIPLIVKNEGMHRKGEIGNLYLVIDIDYDQKITEEQMSAIKTIFKVKKSTHKYDDVCSVEKYDEDIHGEIGSSRGHHSHPGHGSAQSTQCRQQ